jgi:hypothetical protein
VTRRRELTISRITFSAQHLSRVALGPTSELPCPTLQAARSRKKRGILGASDMAIVDRIIFDELVRRELRPDGVASMAAAQRPVARNELLNWLSRNQKKSAIWQSRIVLFRLPKTSKHGGFCK